MMFDDSLKEVVKSQKNGFPYGPYPIKKYELKIYSNSV